MRNLLALVSKIHEKGNRFIIEELKKNGAEGLVPSHGDILVCLYQNNKMTMKDIADTIHRTRPTVTVLVDKLEKSGYLKREISQEDNRYTYIVLTKKGQDFKPVFEKISQNLNDMLYKNLSEQEADILENLLQKI
ncbi:MarR family transcriptional regulator [bacterium]|nr:MarR family transcriptional regulator [bacterium]